MKSNKNLTTEQIIKKRLNKIYFKKDTISLITKILLICIFIFILTKFLITIYPVNGDYMEPNIKDGDLAIVYKLDKEYGIDDVIVYEVDGQKYISRIIAKSGDIVDINNDGNVLINGNIIDEEYIFFETYKSENIPYPITLNDNEVYVLGDMRLKAKDSRDFGVIDTNQIYGKVINIFRNRNI